MNSLIAILFNLHLKINFFRNLIVYVTNIHICEYRTRGILTLSKAYKVHKLFICVENMQNKELIMTVRIEKIVKYLTYHIVTVCEGVQLYEMDWTGYLPNTLQSCRTLLAIALPMEQFKFLSIVMFI